MKGFHFAVHMVSKTVCPRLYAVDHEFKSRQQTVRYYFYKFKSMELQRKYYKITSMIIISLFMISISYYQQVFVGHISALACKYLPTYAIITTAPAPKIATYPQVAAVSCTNRTPSARDASPIKNI